MHLKLHCLNLFAVNFKKRHIYDYIINHTFKKQSWQLKYNICITWKKNVKIYYDIIAYTSKSSW